MDDWRTLSSLLHLVALALWLGAISFVLVVFGPAARRLEPNAAIQILNRGRLSFEAVSWTAIGLVLLTGIVNLILWGEASAAPMAQSYVLALSIKLGLFVAMVAHHCLQVFKYGPQLNIMTGRIGSSVAVWPEPLLAQWQKWFTLLKINATLAPVVTLMGLMLTRG
jgi:putative copper export protein